MDVLKRLRDLVRRVRPELWEGKRWIVEGEAVDCGRGSGGLWKGKRWIVEGEAVDSPPRQCPRALCINLLAPEFFLILSHPVYKM